MRRTCFTCVSVVALCLLPGLARGDDVPPANRYLSPSQASLLTLPFPPDAYRGLDPVGRRDPGPGESDPVRAEGELVIYDPASGNERRMFTARPSWVGLASTDDALPGLGANAADSGDAGLPGVVDGADFSIMNRVGNPDVYPRRTAVQLFITWVGSGGDTTRAVCSGTLINPWYVVTAGHCVYSHDNGEGWPAAIGVAPARNGNDFPYGITQAVSYLSWTGWTDDADYDHDVALMRLENPVGALTGWRNVGYNTGCDWYFDSHWERYTYPAAGSFDGRYMYYDQGTYDGCELVGWEVSHDRQGTKGTSGGGSVKNGAVYAVRSNTFWLPFYGSDSYDTRLTPGKFSDIVNAMRAFEPDVPDLMAFDVKVTAPETPVNAPLPDLDFALFNNSEAAFNGPVSVDVYLSTDPAITSGDLLLGSHSFAWNVFARASQRIAVPNLVIPPAVPPGDYYVGVIITSADSNPANNASPGMPLTVVCQQLGVASLIFPPDEEDCQDLAFTFDWSSIAGATGYRIQVGTSCGAGSIFQSSWSGYSIAGLLPDRTYHWRVRGDLPCGGSGAWSECFHFRTEQTAPSVPVPLEPLDGATCEESEVLLRWSYSGYPSEFQVQFGPGCGNGLLINVLDGYFGLEDLSPNSTYTWRVRMLSKCGIWSDWSDCRSFTTGPGRLSAPQMTSPVDGADCVSTSPTFFWQSVPGAVDYLLVLHRETAGGWSSSSYTVTGLNFSVPGLVSSSAYSWRVRARDSCGNLSDPQPMIGFATGGVAPPAPVGLEPGLSRACSDSLPLLQWSDVPGAKIYEVRYGLQCPLGQPLFTADSTNVSELGFRSALPETTIHWTVRARYTCSGWGPWADCVSFDVRYGPPVVETRVRSTSHEIGAWSNDPQVSLNWFSKVNAGCFTVDSFSLLSDFSAMTLPDSLPELLATGGESVESSVLVVGEGDGRYIHLRPLGEHASASTAGHLGPLRIDLTAPQVVLESPNGGESFLAGSAVPVDWSAGDALSGVASIALEFSENGGQSFVPAGTAVPGDTTFAWTVPAVPGALNRLRVVVTDVAGNAAADTSDADFAIVDPTGLPPGPEVRSLALAPARPNPFTAQTALAFSVPGEGGFVRLAIYDAQGRPLRVLIDGFHAAGRHETIWDGASDAGRMLPGGVYFARIEVDGDQRVRRILKLR